MFSKVSWIFYTNTEKKLKKIAIDKNPFSGSGVLIVKKQKNKDYGYERKTY